MFQPKSDRKSFGKKLRTDRLFSSISIAFVGCMPTSRNEEGSTVTPLSKSFPVKQMCRSKSCVPVRCAGTSYASASARDSILSAQRAGAHRTDYVATMSKTIMNSRFGRPWSMSILHAGDCRTSAVLPSRLKTYMCPYETCTVPDHCPNFPMIRHCAGLLRAHK